MKLSSFFAISAFACANLFLFGLSDSSAASVKANKEASAPVKVISREELENVPASDQRKAEALREALKKPILQEESGATRMSEVVVKAQGEGEQGYSYLGGNSYVGSKTGTPLMDVPASVQVINRKYMDDKLATSPDQVVTAASGITRGATEGNYGFANNYFSRGLDVRLLRDGFNEGVGRYGNYARTLYGIERVEILKGPGSALFGSGSPGGTINFVSMAPSATPHYTVQGLFGSFATYGGYLGATGPVPGTNNELLYRVDADYKTSEGFRDLGEEYGEMANTIQWKPNDKNTLTVHLDYRNIQRQPDTTGIPFKGRSLVPVAFDSKLYTPFADTVTEIMRINMQNEWQATEDLLVRASLVAGQRTLSVQRGRSGVNQPTGLPGNASYYNLTNRRFDDQKDDFKTIIAQLESIYKFNTFDFKHKLLSGFEFTNEFGSSDMRFATLGNVNDVRNPVLPETSIDNVLFTPGANRDLDLRILSLYLQDEIEFCKEVKMRLAGRYDSMRTQDAGYYNVAGTPISTVLAPNGQSYIPNTPVIQYEDHIENADNLTGQAGMVYQPVKETSFYGGVASGVRANFDTESLRSAQKPETSVQLEVGNKTLLFNDRVQTNVALFETTRQNFLQTINGFPVNTGMSRTRGVELDLTLRPIDGWNITMNYAHQRAYYASLNGIANATNKFVAGVPRNLGAIWSTYEIQQGMFKGLGFGGGVTMKDRIWVDQPNTQGIAGYAVGDVVVFYRQPTFDINFSVNNVTDEEWFARAANTAAYPGDTRTFQGSFTYKF